MVEERLQVLGQAPGRDQTNASECVGRGAAPPSHLATRVARSSHPRRPLPGTSSSAACPRSRKAELRCGRRAQAFFDGPSCISSLGANAEVLGKLAGSGRMVRRRHASCQALPLPNRHRQSRGSRAWPPRRHGAACDAQGYCCLGGGHRDPTCTAVCIVRPAAAACRAGSTRTKSLRASSPASENRQTGWALSTTRSCRNGSGRRTSTRRISRSGSPRATHATGSLPLRAGRPRDAQRHTGQHLCSPRS